MAQAELEVGGRRYSLACREGEQARLQALARMVDAKAVRAVEAIGGVNEARQLLFAALLLADELSEARAGLPPSPEAPALAALAERLETLAARLEKPSPKP